jgi:predicted CoA-binding protein
VTPINPRSAEIKLPSKAYPTAASPSALPSPSQTSLSIVTPPKATLQILREAKAAGIPAVWLQPGSFDDEVLEYARKNFQAAVGGDGGNGDEGWCVLVDGEDGLAAAGVNWASQKL